MAKSFTVSTGASGGIGEAMAHLAAEGGRRLVLVARSAKGLKKVADAIAKGGQPRPETIAMDLGRPGAADRLADKLNRAAQLGIVDLNVRALTDLTLRFLPEIIAARGGVLNVASTAAYQPGPEMNHYYARKAYRMFLT